MAVRGAGAARPDRCQGGKVRGGDVRDGGGPRVRYCPGDRGRIKGCDKGRQCKKKEKVYEKQTKKKNF